MTNRSHQTKENDASVKENGAVREERGRSISGMVITAKPVTIDHTGPGGSTPQPPEHGAVVKAWRGFWMFIFKALREAYWVLDKDAKIRSQGLQTLGRITRTRTQEHKDPESGTYYTYHVSYEYQAGGMRPVGNKQVSELGNLKKDAPIRVYYLPGMQPLASALDKNPRALSEREQSILESGPGHAERWLTSSTNGSVTR